MKSIEGQLDIDLYTQRKDSTRVELKSSRPLRASKIFIGKSPEQVLSIIPMLYSICGVAQSRAALTAIEQNLSLSSTASLETARDMLVLVENAKEHLFRILTDWPRLFNLERNNNNLAYLGHLVNDFKFALFQKGDAFSLKSKLTVDIKKTDDLINELDQYLEKHIFGKAAKKWLEIKNIHDLHNWAQQCDCITAKSISTICDQGWASQGVTDCQQLPFLDEAYLLKQFNTQHSENFIAQPQLQGHCYETTTLTRQFDQPLIQSLFKEFHNTLITRWVARLVELANIPEQLRTMRQLLSKTASTDSTSNITKLQGVAQIEAARGRLIHRVNIEQGIISNYQILAPTEWNFHPQGLVAKSLGNLTSKHKDNDIEQLAHLIINSIDPCVGYKLRIHNA